MYAYETDDMDSITKLLDGLDSDESDDLAERRGRRGGRQPAPQTAPGRGSYQPRPPTQDVTQTQLMATIARIEEQIKINSKAITEVNARVNTVADREASQTVVIKKEVAKREKDIKDICGKIELLTLLPLLQKPSSVTLTEDAGALKKGDKVLVDSDNSLNSLLPILLIGGCGSGGGGALGIGGEGGSSNTLLLALAFSGGLGGKGR
jgi:hypothetical protein